MNTMASLHHRVLLLLLLISPAYPFHLSKDQPSTRHPQALSSTTDETASTISRRSLLSIPLMFGIASSLIPQPALAAKSNGISLTTSPSGLRWADVKLGTGRAVSSGEVASIDYSMASTAGRFPQIYTTKDTGAPYRWTVGDGSTISGIERAVVGNDEDGIPPMLPGGIRRVIIPAELGYITFMKTSNAKYCVEGVQGSVGPIPPKGDGSGAYQRWYQFYCNPRIPYQPDLVLDIKLYGKRK